METIDFARRSIIDGQASDDAVLPDSATIPVLEQRTGDIRTSGGSHMAACRRGQKCVCVGSDVDWPCGGRRALASDGELVPLRGIYIRPQRVSPRVILQYNADT